MACESVCSCAWRRNKAWSPLAPEIGREHSGDRHHRSRRDRHKHRRPSGQTRSSPPGARARSRLHWHDRAKRGRGAPALLKSHDGRSRPGRLAHLPRLAQSLRRILRLHADRRHANRGTGHGRRHPRERRGSPATRDRDRRPRHRRGRAHRRAHPAGRLLCGMLGANRRNRRPDLNYPSVRGHRAVTGRRDPRRGRSHIDRGSKWAGTRRANRYRLDCRRYRDQCCRRMGYRPHGHARS